MISQTYEACEALIRKHAPLMMRVGDYREPKECGRVGVPAQWKPPTHGRTIARMKRLRAQGVPIGDIARKCRVSWRTAWKLSVLENTKLTGPQGPV